ncbi:MAG: pyruvate kinase [Clostridia bacterium]|nr:pyruvate kinase [Clostridia bacterium]
MEIYGTFGPACTSLPVLTEMFRSGMCGLRLNLSHRSLEESRDWLELAQKAAGACGRTSQILMDLQGPELRVGREGLPLELPEGETLPLSTLRLPPVLLEQLRPGQELLLDDGKLQAIVGEGETCRVVRGGTLLPRKSVAAPGLDVRLPALTEEDHRNLRLAAQMGVTGVMQSFVRGREDLLALREALRQYGGEHIRIFAKVENRQGLETLPEWIDLADCIVIARGDLGNAVPLWQLPAIQKGIAALCIARGKPFLVVTQLLASMEERAVPTRAEVSDIFNAVLDGAWALMLTGETAAGRYPAEAMAYLCNTVVEAMRFLQMGKE